MKRVSDQPDRDASIGKKVVVSRTDRLGDVVLSLPVFASLKKCLPQTETIALVRKYTSEVALSSPYVDRAIVYEPSESVFSTARKLRKLKADVILILFPRFKVAAAGILAGIPVRVGTAYRWYSFLFNRRIHEHRKDSTKSEAAYNLALLAAIGCQRRSLDITLNVDEEAGAHVDSFINKNCLSKFVIVHPGSGGSAVDWGSDKFREITKQITDLPGLNIVVTGTASERSLCRDVCEGIGNAINAAGQFTMLEFMALISRAELFISNSTGPLHLAAGVGTSLIGIYPNQKPMTPTRWAPLTDRKILLTPKDGSNNLSLVSVDDVMEAVHKLLTKETK
jgi:ADP-heptose:LPS heptosyltransferase